MTILEHESKVVVVPMSFLRLLGVRGDKVLTHQKSSESMTGRETRESPFGMKVPLVPEISSEIVAYCPLKEQVPDV